jgi:transketolase C-terminal domain/subunit
MRTAFIQELIEQARAHPKIFLVVGDLGFSVVEPFAAEFPKRYLNAGVAEQNMTAVAAGLASEGYHVFTYSIGNFPTLRCLEQVRNDICYHDLPVTITAVGGGVAYGNLGYSHHAVQDITVMRSLPNLTVYSPADPGEARECVRLLLQRPRPSYLRLGIPSGWARPVKPRSTIFGTSRTARSRSGRVQGQSRSPPRGRSSSPPWRQRPLSRSKAWKWLSILARFYRQRLQSC